MIRSRTDSDSLDRDIREERTASPNVQPLFPGRFATPPREPRSADPAPSAPIDAPVAPEVDTPPLREQAESQALDGQVLNGKALEGMSVALTGRFASFTQEEMVELIEGLGGEVVREPSADTDLLVIGEDGFALDEDGTPTRNLRRARELETDGAPLRIVGEEEFLSELDLDDRRLAECQQRIHHLYTTTQLSRILDVPGRKIRAWVRAGLIRPARTVHRLCYFPFQQVAVARAISELTRAGLTPRKLREHLEQVRRWVPSAEEALQQLAVIEKGDPLLRLADGTLAEPSGQLRLDFDEEEEATERRVPTRFDTIARPAPFAPTADDVEEPETLDPEAEEWFQLGLELEAQGERKRAVEAHIRALDAGYATPEIFFNLGNLCYALSRYDEAISCFSEATTRDPEYVEAWNNLGNVYSARGRFDQAVHAYRSALAISPDYADAHYNLADTFEQRGDLRRARGHWEAYLLGDPYSESAEQVRAKLRAHRT